MNTEGNNSDVLECGNEEVVDEAQTEEANCNKESGIEINEIGNNKERSISPEAEPGHLYTQSSVTEGVHAEAGPSHTYTESSVIEGVLDSSTSRRV